MLAQVVERYIQVWEVLGSTPGWTNKALSKITRFLFLIEDISELECWHLYKSFLSKEEGSGKYFPLPSSPKRTIVESTFHYPPLLEVSKRGRQFYVIGRMTWKSKQTNKRLLSEKMNIVPIVNKNYGNRVFNWILLLLSELSNLPKKSIQLELESSKVII